MKLEYEGSVSKLKYKPLRRKVNEMNDPGIPPYLTPNDAPQWGPTKEKIDYDKNGEW